MTTFDDWMRKEAKRQDRIVLLQDAFLENRFWAYAAYRLRFFFPRFGLEALLHLVTVVLLFRIFTQAEFIAALVLLTAAGLVRSFWWGSLEVLRERVRQLHRDGRRTRVPAEIGRWLGWSLWLATVIVGVGAVATAWRVGLRGGGLQIIDLYLFSIALGLGVGMVAQCYHSGVFATRRIYRPLAAILGVELLSFVGVIGLWPWIGAWAFPAAGIVSTLVAAGLTFHYTARMYRMFQLEPWSQAHLSPLRTPVRGSLAEWLGAGAGNTVMRLNALLVLLLLAAAGTASHATQLFLVFFAIGPAVSAGADWSRLFYFDLKRLDPKPFQNLNRRFEGFVFVLSAAMGLVTWGAAAVLATLVYERLFLALFLLLLPFFLGRSVLAAAQMSAFTNRAYGRLLASGAILAAGIGTVVFLADDAQAGVVLLSGAVLAAAVFLVARQATERRWLRRGEVSWPTEWLAGLAEATGPVRVSVVRSARVPDGTAPGDGRDRWDETPWLEERIAARIAARLGRQGRATFVYPDRIAWFETGADAGERVGDAWLAREFAGTVERAGDTGVRSGGLACLEAACASGLLGEDVQRAWDLPGNLADPDRLRELFERTVRRGIAYDVDRPAPGSLAFLPDRERRGLVHEAISFARDFRRPGGRPAFDVTAFIVPEGLRLIFVADARADPAAARRWRTFVTRVNVRAALGEARERARTTERPFLVVDRPSAPRPTG